MGKLLMLGMIILDCDLFVDLVFVVRLRLSVPSLVLLSPSGVHEKGLLQLAQALQQVRTYEGSRSGNGQLAFVVRLEQA